MSTGEHSMATHRYVIMANGQGIRWNEYLGIPKHLISVGGETLLERIVRQVTERNATAEIIISSSDPRCESPGAIRYSPRRNEIELDRFVPELLCDGVCFLYGDTYYTDEAMDIIFTTERGALTFFGTNTSLVAIKSWSHTEFTHHLDVVRTAYQTGQISTCKGWQVYRSYAGHPLEGGPVDDVQEPLKPSRSQEISDSISGIHHRDLVRLSDETYDFNRPRDLTDFSRRMKNHQTVILGKDFGSSDITGSGSSRVSQPC